MDAQCADKKLWIAQQAFRHVEVNPCIAVAWRAAGAEYFNPFVVIWVDVTALDCPIVWQETVGPVVTYNGRALERPLGRICCLPALIGLTLAQFVAHPRFAQGRLWTKLVEFRSGSSLAGCRQRCGALQPGRH